MSSDTVLALDLGTGGCKASLWNGDGSCVGETFRAYQVFHPHPGWSEHSVADWLTAVVGCTRDLLDGQAKTTVVGIAVSGHSLGIVLLDRAGQVIEDRTPVWSDSRAVDQTEAVFADVDESEWYSRTGNGFSPALYPLVKARWYATHRPQSWQATATIMGSKDWINYWLTGTIATDHSYASGTGVYELTRAGYADDLLDAGGIRRTQLPDPVGSADQIGTLRPEAAAVLGLAAGIPVFAGAVDNASMALGSRGTAEGRLYASLGSSSWMTVTSASPVLDIGLRPYVFAHAIPGFYISALSTFNSGTSLAWLHKLVAPAQQLVELLDEATALEAASSIPTVVPTLGGGTPLEGGSLVRGAIAGLDLSHGRPQVVRAMLEGIAFSLARSLDWLATLVTPGPELLISGGGARHDGWNQLYADIIGRPLARTAVDQQAAALGAATIAFVGLGAWSFADAERPHRSITQYVPDQRNRAVYGVRRDRFEAVAGRIAAGLDQIQAAS